MRLPHGFPAAPWERSRPRRLRARGRQRSFRRARRAVPAEARARGFAGFAGGMCPCPVRRCTLTTRKGSNRPVRGWQSWTGWSPQRRKRWSKRPQARWSEFSERSSRCSPPRSRRRSRSPSPIQPSPVSRARAGPQTGAGAVRAARPVRGAGAEPGTEPAVARGVAPPGRDAARPTKSRQMRIHRLLPVVVLLLAIVAAPASGDVSSRKQAIDARLQAVQANIARAEQRERELAADIALSTARSATSRPRWASSRCGSRPSSATSRCTRRSSPG